LEQAKLLPQEKALEEFEQSVIENAPLASMTTLGIGGPARHFAECRSSEALSAGAEWARQRGLPFFALGGGSNIVVADRGFPGLVARVAIRGIETRFEGDKVILTAGAGEEWDKTVAMAVERGWAGIECLSGIPGRVGATPIQNVGAYGQETSETLLSLEALDLETGKLVKMNASECEFGYRASRFKTRDRNRYVITRVTYQLTANGKPAIRYAELQSFLSDNGASEPSLSETRSAVIEVRRRKAMVIDPGDRDSRSVGSFFVNPVVTREQFEQVKQLARKLIGNEEKMPAFPASDDRVKLSAAWLIERAGFRRGYEHGNVGTSSRHALAIINRGGGTAREVMELKDMIQKRALEMFGIALAPEPIFVGFE
jgi:UDP-N-acetylmuramate dehydrogenase